MRKIFKLAVACVISTACVISAVPGAVLADGDGGVLDWIDGAVNDTSNWIENAVDDASDWAENAAKDATNWTVNALIDSAGWGIAAAEDISKWTEAAVGDTQNFLNSIFISDETDPSKLVNVEFKSEDGQLVYFLGEAVNAGQDTGYSQSDEITVDDPHFGWTLGNFVVGGFTRVITDDLENPVFLKNEGDEVSLWFRLCQNIDCLNGKESLGISEDTNGYDQYFGVPRTNFGRGTLIIRYTDYQNQKSDPVIYTDFLSGIEAGACTAIDLFEEGDYEVTLDYETDNSTFKLGSKIFPSFCNYKIYFKFSVRNGNCMAFPFDIVTGSELTNGSVTENGFYLDLAMSRYLDITVKKEVLNDTADGLVENTRYNRPAQDGDEYTGEGIYTITTYNKYTGEETVKKIYVGTNEILHAAGVTGMSVQEIKNAVAQGAEIDADGYLKYPE